MRAALIVMMAIAFGMTTGAESGALAANPPRPLVAASPARASQTGVGFEAGPGSVYSSTGAVHVGGAEWMASATVLQGEANLITIYRWRSPKWAVAAKVSMPQIPYLEPGDFITVGMLTHSGAPDFVITTAGADTPWLAVIARIDGKWQSAPFDFGDGASKSLIGVLRNGRLEAEVDGCGCADGTETYTYYRWGNGAFDPTTPPGGSPRCVARGLEHAPVVATSTPPMDALLQTGLSRSLSIGRVACADGWALASVSSKNGPELALFNQQGSAWLRVAVGSARNLANNADGEFAISGPQLVALATRIGAVRELGRMPKVSTALWGKQTVGLSAVERAAVSLYALPGSAYAASQVSTQHGRSWFATAIEPEASSSHSSSSVSSHIYRWNGKAWANEAVLDFELAMAGTEQPVGVVAFGALTSSPDPDFEIGAPGFPAWIAVASDASGAWRFVPFAVGGRSTASVQAVGGPIEPVESFEVQEPFGTVPYSYARGEFRPSGPMKPTPECSLSVFDRLAGNTVLSSVSCGYGHAVVTGTRGGRQIQMLFDGFSGSWSLDFASGVSTFRAEAEQSGSPQWLMTQLDPPIS